MLILFTFLLDILCVPVRVSSHGASARTHVLTRGCTRHIIAKIYASIPDGLSSPLTNDAGKIVAHFLILIVVFPYLHADSLPSLLIIREAFCGLFRHLFRQFVFDHTVNSTHHPDTRIDVP